MCVIEYRHTERKKRQMLRITMTHPTSPLTSAAYPASMEETVVKNLEAQGYTIVMIETLS
jgi:hypothetical protein